MRILDRVSTLKRIISENMVVVPGFLGATALAFRQKYFANKLTVYRNLQFRGYSLEARHCDWLAVREVLVEKEYDFLADLLKDVEQPTVIDAGANIGTFALVVFSLYPDARVFSFEAAPGTAAILHRNAKLNSHLSWETRNEALWSGLGTVRVSDTMSSISNSISTSGQEGTAVPAIGLETVLERTQGRADLMKIDIEGGEEDFLRGQSEALRSVRQLVLELHPDACNITLLLEEIRSVYPNIYRLSRVMSAKPLILATDKQYPFPTFQFPGVTKEF